MRKWKDLHKGEEKRFLESLSCESDEEEEV